jgi:hypothetical protein
MRKKISTCLTIFPAILMLQSCLQCISGGKLHVKRKYVSNVCGLLNGVFVSEIRVDSFHNGLPVKYANIRSTTLYRNGASPNKDPKRLYYAKDCKRVFLWQNNKIKDTINQPMTFSKSNWYLFDSYDANTAIFMHIDSTGKRRLQEVERRSGFVNF